MGEHFFILCTTAYAINDSNRPFLTTCTSPERLALSLTCIPFCILHAQCEVVSQLNHLFCEYTVLITMLLLIKNDPTSRSRSLFECVTLRMYNYNRSDCIVTLSFAWNKGFLPVSEFCIATVLQRSHVTISLITCALPNW